MKINLTDKSIFHVHTFRCGHAENVPDEKYIEEAIKLGSSDIWFSDHAPFPGDPFGSRMGFDELQEYLEALSCLKKKYQGAIDVHIGLEMEYFPSYDEEGYYSLLRKDERIEMLLLGQHMAEIGDRTYTFNWFDKKLEDEEYIALGNAIMAGIKSGYFDAVAHPDRIFRRRTSWDQDMEAMSVRIIEAAHEANILLEQNRESMEYENYYWPQFWSLTGEGIKVITGLDAHSISDMARRYLKRKEI